MIFAIIAKAYWEILLLYALYSGDFMESLAPSGEAFIIIKISTGSTQCQESRTAVIVVSPWAHMQLLHTSVRYKCAEGAMHVQQNPPLDLD